ncbi:MAG: SRPBCC family protein, partial [Acidobacteria bacterium]|nr:SRPBCC family protein [Acidobacteriota bacterium]MCA1608903.1 SRPBCC family protein [Acidobacteriota bacterium]
MIKKVLVVLAVLVLLLIGLVAVGAFVAQTEFKVEREIVVNRPVTEVYSYAKMVRNQNEWGPWAKRDPNLKQEFRGTDGTVGFVSHWKSDNGELGEGEQEITRLIENERVDVELRFKDPMESKNAGYLATEPVGPSQTKVKWGFTGTMPRPLNLMA